MPDAEGQDDFYISTSSHHIYKAFVGMFCLVRQDSSKRLGRRALVTDMLRSIPRGILLKRPHWRRGTGWCCHF